MTYEQLQKISGIHRNSLRKRLDELVNNGLIIEYKFSLPKNDLSYGNTSEYRHLPDCRIHYLLNIFKDETKTLLKYYYMPEEDERERENLTQAINSRPALSENIGTRIDDIKTKPVEPSRVEKYIRIHELSRQLKISVQISDRIRIPSTSADTDKDRDEIRLENVTDFAEHIIRFGYSIADLIIRLCDSPIISTRDLHYANPKFLIVPMFDYLEVLDLLSISKYRKELFEIFNLSSLAI